MGKKMDSVTSASNTNETSKNAAALEDNSTAPQEAQKNPKNSSATTTEETLKHEPEMEDSDSADEKVEHYLESPEKEPQRSPEKEQPQKEENKTCEIAAPQEENQESHAATCNLHLQNNKEIDNNIMEEKLIEVKSPTHSFASSSSGSYSVNNTENGK